MTSFSASKEVKLFHGISYVIAFRLSDITQYNFLDINFLSWCIKANYCGYWVWWRFRKHKNDQYSTLKINDKTFVSEKIFESACSVSLDFITIRLFSVNIVLTSMLVIHELYEEIDCRLKCSSKQTHRVTCFYCIPYHDTSKLFCVGWEYSSILYCTIRIRQAFNAVSSQDVRMHTPLCVLKSIQIEHDACWCSPIFLATTTALVK